MEYELNEVYDFKNENGYITQVKIIGEFKKYVLYAYCETGHSNIIVKCMTIEEMKNGIVRKSKYDEFEQIPEDNVWLDAINDFICMRYY